MYVLKVQVGIYINSTYKIIKQLGYQKLSSKSVPIQVAHMHAALTHRRAFPDRLVKGEQKSGQARVQLAKLGFNSHLFMLLQKLYRYSVVYS